MKYRREEAPYFAVSPEGYVVWSYGLPWAVCPSGSGLVADQTRWHQAVAWSLNHDGQVLIKPYGSSWLHVTRMDPEWEVLDGPEDLGILPKCESKTAASVTVPSARASTSSTRSKKKVTRSVHPSLPRSGG